MDLLSHSLSRSQKKERKEEVVVFSQQTSWQVGAEENTGVINNFNYGSITFSCASAGSFIIHAGSTS